MRPSLALRFEHDELQRRRACCAEFMPERLGHDAGQLFRVLASRLDLVDQRAAAHHSGSEGVEICDRALSADDVDAKPGETGGEDPTP